jgi:hypothetical protein
LLAPLLQVLAPIIFFFFKKEDLDQTIMSTSAKFAFSWLLVLGVLQAVVVATRLPFLGTVQPTRNNHRHTQQYTNNPFGLLSTIRGGESDPGNPANGSSSSKIPKKKSGSSSSTPHEEELVEDQEEDWQDAMEEEDEDWTDEEEEGTQLQQAVVDAEEWLDQDHDEDADAAIGGDVHGEEEYDLVISEEEEEEEGDFLKEKSSALANEEEQVSLSEVLQQHQEDDADSMQQEFHHNNQESQEVLDQEEEDEEEDDDDLFVDALEYFHPAAETEDTDTVLVSPAHETTPISTSTTTSGVHTDDDSSAFVDRMELADAYDEGLGGEEDADNRTPVLANTMGGTEEDEEDTYNLPASSSATDISPGGGTDDDDADSDEAASLLVEEEAAADLVEETDENTNADDEIKEAVTAGSTRTEITDEMKQVMLKELHWKQHEVANMRPDIAAVVVHKQLRRPREGMPEPWYRPGTGPNKMVQKVVVPVCVAAAAIYAGQKVEITDVGKFVQQVVPSFSLTLPAKMPFLSSTTSQKRSPQAEEADEETTTTNEDEPPTSMGDEQEESIPTTTATPGGTTSSGQEYHTGHHLDHHANSVKPYVHSVDDDPDESWLDKIISKIENAIKGILSKEL